MFLIIDNNDFSTYNLAQIFEQLGQNVKILKNNTCEILELAKNNELKAVCLSSGFKVSNSTNLCLNFLKLLNKFNPQIPLLAIGLGQNILGEFFAAKITKVKQIRYGESTNIQHYNNDIFSKIPEKFQAGIYHSFVLDALNETKEEKPFKILAKDELDEIMAIKIRNRNWYALQFHPESVLSPEGISILNNFLTIGKIAKKANFNNNISKNNLKSENTKTPYPISTLMEEIGSGYNLNEEKAKQLFSRLMEGELSNSQAGALLMGLRVKGETALEMAEAATAVLEKSVKIPKINATLLDIVGTGGDNKNSFNCSTATALTMAGLGYKVVKQGNRSVSSNCGSADILEALGIDINIPPEKIIENLEKNNFAFLFAPNYHPAFKHIMPVRSEMGIRTLFNLLGPLVNPAKPQHSLIGSPNVSALSLLANTLSKLDTTLSAVIYGAGGYDELTTLGPNKIILVEGNKLKEITIDPSKYGFSSTPESELTITGPTNGLFVITELLSGRGNKAMREMLSLNVAMSLYLMHGAINFKKCVNLAKEAINDGVGSWALKK